LIDERSGKDMLRKYNVLIAHYLHIPDPNALSDEQYYDKVHEVTWLMKFIKGDVNL
jgi:hypothetical protein